MPARTPRFIALTGFMLLFATSVTAQVKEPAAGTQLVTPAALAKLLPTMEGWTRTEPRLNEIDSDGCAYTLAAATYTNGDIRLKLTLADTGGHAETLAILASTIANFPDDFEGKMPPATTIKRWKTDVTRASEMWDTDKQNGELTVVVSGRFVVAIETQKAESPETLRALLKAVDLKALAALK